MKVRLPAVPLLMTMMTMLMTRQTLAFPGGAPPYNCRTMRPGHSSSPAAVTDSIPFIISASNYAVQPGEVVDTSVTSKTPGEEFQGLLAVSTKLEGGNAEIVTGMVPIEQGAATKTINCLTGNNQAVPLSGLTHTRKLATSETTFQWMAPPTALPGSTYQIKVVIVQSFYVFWEPVVLNILIRNSNSQTSSENTTTTVSQTPANESLTTQTSNPPSTGRSASSSSSQSRSDITTAPSPLPDSGETRTSFPASSAISSNSSSTTTTTSSISSSSSPTTASLDVRVGRTNRIITNNRAEGRLASWLSSLFG